MFCSVWIFPTLTETDERQVSGLSNYNSVNLTLPKANKQTPNALFAQLENHYMAYESFLRVNNAVAIFKKYRRITLLILMIFCFDHSNID